MASNLSYDPPPTAQQRPQPPQDEHPQDPYARYAQQQAPQEQPFPPPRPQPWQQQVQPPPGIDPRIWSAIRGTAAQLSWNQEAFIQQLHYDLTALMPAPAPDMWAFCDRIVQSLLWVALTDQPLWVVADTLLKVGAQNWAEGFPDALYGNVGHALVQTVHCLSLGDWSASAGSVWVSYFAWVKPHLLAGAEQAAAQHAAAQQAAERQAAAQRAAAEREAARVTALSRDSRGGHTQVVGDVNIESVASLLDDEDDEDVGYGQIMVSMTRNRRREPPRRS